MYAQKAKDAMEAAALGHAVGDAIGFQVERQDGGTCSRHAASWLYGDGASQPMRDGHATGQVSDDTQMSLATLRSLASGGDPEEGLARALCAMRGDIVGGGRTSLSMLDELSPIIEEEASLAAALDRRDAGAPFQAASNGAVMRAWPYGLANLDEAGMRRAAALSARITHRHPDSTSGAVATAAFTRAVARRGLDGAVDEAMSIAAGDDNAVEMLRVAKAIVLAPSEHAMAAVWILGGADPVWRHVSPSPRATLAWAVRSFEKGEGDYRATISHALCAGGDVDTVAGLAGAWCAIASGIESIPAALRDIPTDRGRWGHREIRAAARNAV